MQADIVEEFRQDDSFPILVSTSVTEEGFDIPKCNTVICYEKIASFRQFIQLKGRARSENSKFFVICPEHEKKQTELLL